MVILEDYVEDSKFDLGGVRLLGYTQYQEYCSIFRLSVVIRLKSM